MTRTSQAATFLSCLFDEYTSGYLEIRTLNQGRSQMRFYPLPMTQSDYIDVARACVGLSDAGDDVYMGVLPRHRQGGKDADVDTAGFLWADIDSLDGVDVDSLRDRSSLLVYSGRGIHCYAGIPITDIGTKLITQRVTSSLVEVYGRSLSEHADLKVKNPSRILRVPGTKNWKDRDNPLDVVLDTYPLEALIEAQDADTDHPWGVEWSALLVKAQTGDLPTRTRGNWNLGTTTAGGNYHTYSLNLSVISAEYMRSIGMTDHAHEVMVLCRTAISAGLESP